MTSELTRRFQPSPTLTVPRPATEPRAVGRDIDLGAGEPDFDTPEQIKAAGRRALDDVNTKNKAADGTRALTQAIVQKFERENDLRYEPDEIIVSSGAKHSIYDLARAVLNPGDEVIIPTPYWSSYTTMVASADARPIFLETTMEQSFKINPLQLNASLNERTRLLILNSPANPTGACYTRDELEELGEVLRKNDRVLVASDDIYEHIRWLGVPFCNIVMACPDLKERCIVINGVSKAFAMAGWGIGYAAAPKAVVAAMRKLQSQSTSNPNFVAQAASVCALNAGSESTTAMVREFEERHAYVVQRLVAIENVRCLPASGTYYVFPDVRAAINAIPGVADDVGFVADLLDATGVAVVPGTAFGSPGHVRVSFAADLDRLRHGLNRIEAFVSQAQAAEAHLAEANETPI